MDSIVFVNRLKALTPLRENLEKYNLPNKFIDDLIDSYNCPPSETGNNLYFGSDSILLLLINYDCSHVEIGLVTFLEVPTEYEDFYHIGLVEVDVLVINKITLRVEVRDYAALYHVIWPCAANSDCFLEALLVCAEYLTFKISNISQEENVALLISTIDECVEKAGGEDYRNFYEMLLGYHE